MEKINTFEKLNSINVNDKIKTKMNLSYLSWAYAWGELLSNYPNAFMTVYTRTLETTETLVQEDPDNHITKTTVTKNTQEIPYFTDGRSCFVKVGVTVEGTEYIEYYPIMGLKNDAIRATSVTMTDVNKALQRAFVKACARHGLGLYIYAGEDVPEVEKNTPIEISSNNDFESVKTDVINLVRKLESTRAEPEIRRYILEMFPNVRLSATTPEHLDKLMAARTYLAKVQEDLGK